MIRNILILSAFVISNQTFAAADTQKESTPVPTAVVENGETIIHQKSLATHMGWSDQQAVFKAPRNFRQHSLNEIGTDSIEALPADDSSTN